jgi:hypothetical protein
MSSRKTLDQESIDNELLRPADETTTKTKKKVFKSITREHVQAALTMFLLATSMIDDDEEVSYFGVGDRFGTFHFSTEKLND